MNPQMVADRINRHKAMLIQNDGGITFSGGEPLMQPDFVMAVRQALPDLHACIETSGHANTDIFQHVIDAMDLTILDIKLMNPVLHKKYTGVDNTLIQSNLSWLISTGKLFRVRIPLIPTLTDTREHLSLVAKRLRGVKSLEKVELMRYNHAAGSKYASVGLAFHALWPENHQPFIHTEVFEELNIPCIIL